MAEMADKADKIVPRLKTKYTEEVRPALLKEFQHGNVMEVAGITKVVVNMGVGEAAHDSKMIEGAVRRLVSITLPRIRDFRGLSPKQFDGNGNYTFGVAEQSIFPEINQDQIDRVRGFDITVVTTAKTDDEGRALLRLVKVVVNMGVGEAARDAKLIDGAVRDLTTITGQKPLVRRATKSIAQFKLREGMPIGAHSTLRGDRMWEFLDRLVSISLPRIRDFRGLSPKQFDGNGNYTFGLTEQAVFHEIDQDKIDRVRGMDITVVTTAKTDEEARSLLKQLGFPFKEK